MWNYVWNSILDSIVTFFYQNFKKLKKFEKPLHVFLEKQMCITTLDEFICLYIADFNFVYLFVIIIRLHKLFSVALISKNPDFLSKNR